MERKKIAITGLGVFAAAGKDIPSFTDALLHGRCAIGPVNLFKVDQFASQVGAQLHDFNPHDYFTPREAAKLSRADQFGVIAAGQALAESGVCSHYSPYDIGISMGAGAAGMFQAEQWLQETMSGRKPDPSLLRGILPDRTSTAIAQKYGIGGYQGSITTACSSSANAIGWGADLIVSGRLKAAICGGADCLSQLTFAGFNSLRVVDTEPCAPFSLGRRGISLGEGAAFLVLEDEAAARTRGAQIHGYILGYAVAGEAHHMTAPAPDGVDAARLMEAALVQAGATVAEVGWVNAHGTATPLNDVVETKAMKLVFGERASSVPIVSTKALTGHCLGAAGAIEALATVIGLSDGFIPQTLNFRGADPECDLDYCHDGTKASSATLALSNSFAFGGNITTLVLGK